MMMRETPSATAKRHRRFQPRQVGPLTASSHQDLLKSPVYLFQGDACHRGKDQEPRTAQVDLPAFTTSVATTRQPAGSGDQGQRARLLPSGHTGHAWRAERDHIGPARMPITQTRCPASSRQVQELWVRDAAACGGLEVHKPSGINNGMALKQITITSIGIPTKCHTIPTNHSGQHEDIAS